MPRTTFEGYRTTTRSVAMIEEARRLWHANPKSNGKHHPAIVQGGYRRGKTAASAGTHDKDAADFDTGYLNDDENLFWQRCLRTVGFKSWWRRRLYVGGRKIWNEHNHSIPEGGDLSRTAKVQVKAAHAGRNGLKSNLRDHTWDGLERRTWEQYLKLHPKPKPKPAPKPIRKFRLSDFKGSVKVAAYNRSYPSHVAVCQTALQALGYEPGPVDGIKGKQTISAMNRFLAKWGWESASGRILTLRQLDRLISEAEKLHPGTGYPPRAEK